MPSSSLGRRFDPFRPHQETRRTSISVATPTSRVTTRDRGRSHCRRWIRGSTRAVRGRRFVLADTHQSRMHQVATSYAYGLLDFFATSFRGQACGGSGYRYC